MALKMHEPAETLRTADAVEPARILTEQSSGPALDLRKRVFALDVLRGVAILLVLPSHQEHLSDDTGWLGHVDRFFGRFGWTGVDLFFVLSGFLIGGLLFRELKQTGKLNVRRFLTRRALKLWPAYFALLAWATFKSVRHGEFKFAELWPSLLQIQNYCFAVRAHTWSLAVEEHFYVSLAVALGLLMHLRRGMVEARFASMAIIVIVVVAVGRYVQALLIPWSVISGYFATHVRIDSLLFGVLIAHIATFQPKLWSGLLDSPWWLIGLGLLLVSPAMFFQREVFWIHTAGYTLLYLGYGSILVGAMGLQSRSDLGRAGLWRRFVRSLLAAVAWVGVFSYGIYLWHIDLAQQPVSFHLKPKLGMFTPNLQWCIAMFAYLCAAIIAGVVMTYIIEVPILHLRERWFPRPVNPASAREK